MENKEKSCSSGAKGLCCPISGCPIKDVVILTLVAFAVMFGFEWVFHGIYMMPDYEATAAMWRSEAEMQELFHICLIRKGLMALAIGGLFAWAGKSCGGICCPVKGAKFGLLLGLLLGASMFGSYLWMPIPFDMAIKWLVGEVLMGALIGAALALVTGLALKKGTSACKAE